MNTKAKALEQARDTFNKHAGHTLTYSYCRHPDFGRSFVLGEAVIIGENLMLKAKGEPFATHYSDAMFECSCSLERKSEH